ncbi:hypothetical protein ALC53_06984 [Atta colombica]|uniref:Uncharacterized protein n=1 Tax=Atta colombica TaxID=520822 RepID=A0A195BE57_9HYME|nr:hypothetical protein ALC53_06984 [Atta colombica]
MRQCEANDGVRHCENLVASVGPDSPSSPHPNQAECRVTASPGSPRLPHPPRTTLAPVRLPEITRESFRRRRVAVLIAYIRDVMPVGLLSDSLAKFDDDQARPATRKIVSSARQP